MVPFKHSIPGLLAGLVVLGISGCTTLGPDYQEPEVSWINQWETDLYGQLGEAGKLDGMDLRFWWRAFDDPVLEELIKLTKEANPSLKIAGLRILESRAQLGQARSGRYPQVQQATGNLTYVNARDSDGGSQSYGNYGLGVGAGWEVDFWGKYKRGIESADAAFFSSIANQQNLQVLLYAQVADLYYAYRTTELRIKIAEHNAAVQKRSYEITKTLYEEGDKSELDLQQAKTQYMATLSTIPGLEIELTQLRNGLCVLAARPPGHLPELGSSLDALPEPDPVEIGTLPASLLMRRPDVRASAFQVAAQSAQIGLAKTELYPSVSLLGSLGWSGLSTSGTPETMSLSIGPAFKWNIFDYGRIKNNVRVQDARLQQAIENFQNVVLEASREIDNAAISVAKTIEQKEPQHQSTLAATRSLELATQRYREGYADFQRVIEAQRAAAAQADLEVINQSRHISGVIALYKALGGGWTESSIEELIPESTRQTMEDRTNWDDLLRNPLPDVNNEGENHE